MAEPGPLYKQLLPLANPAIAEHSAGFFKTGPGEYGEGDQFLGIRVPVLRQQAVKRRDLSLDETLQSLRSPWHEERLCALIVMVGLFEKADEADRQAIYSSYLDHSEWVNNWDLVDSSAHQIVGGYLRERPREPLYILARSAILWERRIAIIATLHFIRQNDLDDCFALSELLLGDAEDLMHKTCGWMLREAGKRDTARLRDFIKQHYPQLPRTLLRYAIEKFPQPERGMLLRGEF